MAEGSRPLPDTVLRRFAHGTALSFAVAAMVLAEIDLVRLVEGDAVETVWLLVIALISVAAASIAMLDGETVPIDGPALRLLAALGAWLVLAALVSDAPIDALAAALAYVALGIVAVRVQHAYGWVPVAIACVAVLAGYLVASLSAEVLADPQLRVEGRLVLLSVDANQLARLGGVALISGIALIASRGYYAVVIGVVTIPIAVLALVLSQSRTGTVAVAAAAAVLIWRWIDWRVAIGVCLLGAVGFGLLAPKLFDTSVQQLVARDGENASLSTFRGRTTTWESAADEVRATPLFGHGPSLDDEFFAAERQAGEISWPARNAHNLLGHFAVVGGLPAVLFFGAALAMFVLGRGARPAAFGFAVVTLLVLDGVSEAVLWVPGLASFLIAATFAMRGPSPTALDPFVEVGTLGADRGRVPVAR